MKMKWVLVRLSAVLFLGVICSFALQANESIKQAAVSIESLLSGKKNEYYLKDPFTEHFAAKIKTLLKCKFKNDDKEAQEFKARETAQVGVKLPQIAEGTAVPDELQVTFKAENKPMTVVAQSCHPEPLKKTASQVRAYRFACKTKWYWLSPDKERVLALHKNAKLLTFINEPLLQCAEYKQAPKEKSAKATFDVYKNEFRGLSPLNFPSAQSTYITQCYDNYPTHQGPAKFALDFGNFDEGTAIVNVKEGIVVQVDTHSEVFCKLGATQGKKWWAQIYFKGQRVNDLLASWNPCDKKKKKGKPDPKCKPENEYDLFESRPGVCSRSANQLFLRHPDGSLSSYTHLSAEVPAADFGYVLPASGYRVANSGLSGALTGPHLHFEANVIAPGKKTSPIIASIPTNFNLKPEPKIPCTPIKITKKSKNKSKTKAVRVRVPRTEAKNIEVEGDASLLERLRQDLEGLESFILEDSSEVSPDELDIPAAADKPSPLSQRVSYKEDLETAKGLQELKSIMEEPSDEQLASMQEDESLEIFDSELAKKFAKGVLGNQNLANASVSNDLICDPNDAQATEFECTPTSNIGAVNSTEVGAKEISPDRTPMALVPPSAKNSVE